MQCPVTKGLGTKRPYILCQVFMCDSVYVRRVFRTGLIILYRLYHNGILVYNSSTACNITLTHLETWSAHEFRLETCTAVGCSSSRSVLARTQELPPQGLVGLVVNVTSPHSVLVYWTAVSAPNGLLRYDVYFTGPFYTHQRTSSCLLISFSRTGTELSYC